MQMYADYGSAFQTADLLICCQRVYVSNAPSLIDALNVEQRTVDFIRVITTVCIYRWLPRADFGAFHGAAPLIFVFLKSPDRTNGVRWSTPLIITRHQQDPYALQTLKLKFSRSA